MLLVLFVAVVAAEILGTLLSLATGLLVTMVVVVSGMASLDCRHC